MTKRDPGQRGAAARIMDDLRYDSLQVAVAFPEIKRAEPGRALAVVCVRLEDGARSLTLCSNDSSHLSRFAVTLCLGFWGFLTSAAGTPNGDSAKC